MPKNDHFHYLIKAIYRPRTVAYCFGVFVTLSQFSLWSEIPVVTLGLIVICLFYPHLTYWISGRYFNSAGGARGSLLIDSVLTGCLVIANGFYLFSAVSFVVALALGTLIISRPWIMGLSLLLLVLTILPGWLLGVPIQEDVSTITDILCSLSLVSYTCVVAVMGFKVTADLGSSRRLVQANNKELDGITRRLRRYLSPQLYPSIMSSKTTTSRKHLTVFFSDIEGFTELMDSLEEETVTMILNDYLNNMADIAIDFGGTVDKFIGDGIMIFFGDPHSDGAMQDALHCMRMSLEMRRQLGCLRNKWRQAGVFSDLHIRMGINTGYCTVGNFGSEQKMDYTAVGSVVNIASRLEGMAARDTILISDSSHRLIAGMMECRQCNPVIVKGIKQAVKNYELIGENTVQTGMIEYGPGELQISLDPSLIDVEKVDQLPDPDESHDYHA